MLTPVLYCCCCRSACRREQLQQFCKQHHSLECWASHLSGQELQQLNSSRESKLAPAQSPAGWKAANPGKVGKVGKCLPVALQGPMPRRRERLEPQGDILSPFDLAKKLRGAVQAKDLKALERLFQRSEVCDMDDRRCARQLSTMVCCQLWSVDQIHAAAMNYHLKLPSPHQNLHRQQPTTKTVGLAQHLAHEVLQTPHGSSCLL